MLVRYLEPLLRAQAVPRRKRLSELGSIWHNLPEVLMRTTRRAALIIVTRLWLYILALRVGADVYHCNDLDTLDVGAVMKITGKRLVYDSHELYVDQISPRSLRTLCFAFEKLLVKLADVVITVNPFIASELRRRYSIERMVHVVLNCPRALPDQLARRRVANRSGVATVLYHGGLYPERGLENLVRASPRFKEHVRLILRGDGELEHTLKKLASGSHNVVFERGVPMDAVIDLATQADIGVIPYLPTNLNHIYCSPNKLFEYIQAGLAVVTSDFPFLREVVVGRSIGLVFDPLDPTDIAEKINQVADKRTLSGYKRNAVTIRGLYSWEHERAKLFAAYKNLELSN
jgi:glycosyltransferase involved in cell wall biosynthesis